MILHIVWKITKPQNASIAGRGALIAVCVDIILYVALGAGIFSMV